MISIKLEAKSLSKLKKNNLTAVAKIPLHDLLSRTWKILLMEEKGQGKEFVMQWRVRDNLIIPCREQFNALGTLWGPETKADGEMSSSK